MAGNAEYESGLALRKRFDEITPFGWSFYGLEHTAGGCFAYRFHELDGDGKGYILVTGDDVLSADGSVSDFGSVVSVGQYIYDRETGYHYTPDGELADAHFRDAVVPFSGGVDEIAEAVRSVFVRWGLVK